MHCKSLWIEASAKCIHVNVKDHWLMGIVSKYLEKVLCFEKLEFWSVVVNYVSRVLKNDMKVLLLVQKLLSNLANS